MNRLSLTATLLLTGYATALVQQSEQKDVATPAPFASVEAKNQNPSSRTSHRPASPELLGKWTQASVQEPSRLGDLLSRTEPSFVWVNGGFYTVLGSGLRIPVPGGGASGCFNLGLSERIEKIDRFVERVTEGKQTQEQQPKVKLPQVL